MLSMLSRSVARLLLDAIDARYRAVQGERAYSRRSSKPPPEADDDDAPPPFIGLCALPNAGAAVELAQMPVEPGCLLSAAIDGPAGFLAPSAVDVGEVVVDGPAMLHRSSNAAAPLLAATGGALRVVLTLLAEGVAESIGRPRAGFIGTAEIGGDIAPPGRAIYG